MWGRKEIKTSRQRLDQDLAEIKRRSVLAAGSIYLISQAVRGDIGQAGIVASASGILIGLSIIEALRVRTMTVIKKISSIRGGKIILKDIVLMEKTITEWRRSGRDVLSDFRDVIDRYENLLEKCLDWEGEYHIQKGIKRKGQRMRWWRELGSDLKMLNQEWSQLSFEIGLLAAVYKEEGAGVEVIGKARRIFALSFVDQIRQRASSGYQFVHCLDYDNLLRIALGVEDLWASSVFEINELGKRVINNQK
jgi:hypothetical protein